ncbi:hypothetical protein KS878_003864 [Vibrio parahaemolyticus]|nr:hypothetical protein [Vibrio parahaemolyticus]
MAEKLTYLGFCFGNALKGIDFTGYVTVITASNDGNTSLILTNVTSELLNICVTDKRVCDKYFLCCSTTNACFKVKHVSRTWGRQIPLVEKQKACRMGLLLVKLEL